MRGYYWIPLLFVLLFTVEGAAAVRPPAPSTLEESFVALDTIEQNLDKGEWKTAYAGSKDLQRDFGILMRLLPVADPDMYYDFGYALGKFQGYLINRDRSGSEKCLVDLRNLYLRISGQFHYPVPLALGIIERHFARAREHHQKKQYREIVIALREIGQYFKSVYTLLEERGVETLKVWDFHSRINQAMAAAEIHNYERTALSLQQLEEDIEAFIALFDTAKEEGRTVEKR